MSFSPDKDPARRRRASLRRHRAGDRAAQRRSRRISRCAARCPTSSGAWSAPSSSSITSGRPNSAAARASTCGRIPHIGLATVTFLFDGEIMHRDSLGTAVPIRPGEVNWMTAGRGIVHSERTAPERRTSGEPLHGLQCWVALPAAGEEIERRLRPSRQRGASGRDRRTARRVRVVAGSLYGARSPVPTLVGHAVRRRDARRRRNAAVRCRRPRSARSTSVDGEIDIAGDRFAAGRLLVFRPGDAHHA